MGGAVASWLVRSTPERAVRVRGLAGDIVLCSWAWHFTLTVLLSTQVYKWVPADCWGNLTNCGEVTCDGLASCSWEVEILLGASCYRNRDKLRQLWASLGSKASLCIKSDPFFQRRRECSVFLLQWSSWTFASTFWRQLAKMGIYNFHCGKG